jgi:hypothetical protein
VLYEVVVNLAPILLAAYALLGGLIVRQVKKETKYFCPVERGADNVPPIISLYKPTLLKV